MRKLHKKWAKANMIVIFINHTISNIANTPFAKKTTTGGGNSIKFLASLRVEFSSGTNLNKQFKGEKQRVGQKSFIKIEKLRGSPLVFNTIECPLLDECGFDSVGSLLNATIKSGMTVEKSGKLYSLDIEGQDPIEFKRAEWAGVVESLGGFESFYDFWIQSCLDSGTMLPWSEV